MEGSFVDGRRDKLAFGGEGFWGVFGHRAESRKSRGWIDGTTLAQYHSHLEAKSLAPHVHPCEKQTIGLLGRRPPR